MVPWIAVSGEVVGDRRHEPVTLLTNPPLPLRSVNGVFSGDPQPTHKPSDDYRHGDEQAKVDHVANAGDCRTSDRFSQQHVVADAACDGCRYRRTPPSTHGERNDKEHHEMFEHKRGQGDGDSDADDGERNGYRHCIPPSP
jgi:hypothetical protein